MNLRLSIRKFALKYGLDPAVFRKLVQKESGGDQDAKSPMGAIGLTQLMPDTARSLGVNPYDAEQNLEGGAKYLAQQLHTFGGDYRKALAAYNAGPGAVQKYGGIPPFAETQNYVKSILSRVSDGSERLGRSDSGTARSRVSGMVLPGSIPDFSAQRNAAVFDFLQRGGVRNTSALPALTSTIAALQQQAQQQTIPPITISGPSVKPVPSAKPGSNLAAELTVRANQIDAQRLPYKWGGGHGGKVNPSKAEPLDCSGAVSAVLGIDPRVSGQFTSWGKPGDGGNKGVTVYANAGHVLMKINGHFFGTSATNPGGGAGWIKQKDISPGYLKRFTARHA